MKTEMGICGRNQFENLLKWEAYQNDESDSCASDLPAYRSRLLAESDVSWGLSLDIFWLRSPIPLFNPHSHALTRLFPLPLIESLLAGLGGGGGSWSQHYLSKSISQNEGHRSLLAASE